jgi:signal transduction histidine kinase
MVSNPLKRSLRAKVTLGIVLPLLLILGLFTAIEYSHHQAAVLDNLSSLASLSGHVIESDLRHAMLDSDFTEVQALLDTMGRNEEFKDIYVLDISGKVIFAPDNQGVGTRLDYSQSSCQPCHRLPVESRPKSVVVVGNNGQRLFRSVASIENGPACAECHDSNQHLLGLLITDISLAPMENALAADFREKVLWWIAAILTTIVVVYVVLSRFVIRRIEGLAAAIAGLGEGQLPGPLPEDKPDEIGRLATAFNLMAQQVESRNVENRELSEGLHRQSAQRGELLKRLITAQESERRRVARELHDELGQTLGGLALRTEVVKRYIETDPERAVEQLGEIHALITETTNCMYNLILYLRPSALDDLGLAAALRGYADRLLAHSDICFALDAVGLTTRLLPSVETSLYRVFQETLNNVVRHAAASRISIRLAHSNGAFEGEIVDDGKGFDLSAVRLDGQSPHGLGLMGIQERITQCGGEVEIITEPGQGTRVNIRIPTRGDSQND